MSYAIYFVIGIVAGAVSVFGILANRRRTVGEIQRRILDLQRQADDKTEASAKRERELREQIYAFNEKRSAFDARVIAYDELKDENSILKHDLQNVDVNLRKLQLDGELREEAQELLEQKTNKLGERFLKENIKWIGASLSASNYSSSKKKLLKVIESCRSVGFDISTEEEAEYLDGLKLEYETAVRVALEREEQARIKQQIREEQKLEREIDRELKTLERERAAIETALEKALSEAKDEHSAEVEGLRARLREAAEKTERTKSRAEMTKSGHVYVISNIGSFGEDIYKIGLTRRLEPMDRVKELGDASVPFPFDVHMMISSDDARALENSLHRAFHRLRVNKANPRKEFFRMDLAAIVDLVSENHGEIDYVASPEALEYRQSIEMSEDDVATVENIYGRLDGEHSGGDED